MVEFPLILTASISLWDVLKYRLLAPWSSIIQPPWKLEHSGIAGVGPLTDNHELVTHQHCVLLELKTTTELRPHTGQPRIAHRCFVYCFFF